MIFLIFFSRKKPPRPPHARSHPGLRAPRRPDSETREQISLDAGTEFSASGSQCLSSAIQRLNRLQTAVLSCPTPSRQFYAHGNRDKICKLQNLQTRNDYRSRWSQSNARDRLKITDSNSAADRFANIRVQTENDRGSRRRLL